MDEICSAILTKLCDLGEVGNFLILEEEELFEIFPEGAEKSRTVLDEALKRLKASGFIEIRYSRGNLFCLAPLKKFEKFEPLPEIKIEPNLKKSYVLFAGCSFTFSFLGAFLGGLIAGLF